MTETGPDMKELRAAVVEAAERGLRRAPRVNRKNAFHKPNPQRDAATFFTARRKDVAESFEQHGAEYLIGGIDQWSFDRAIRYATAAQAALSAFLEACNARRAP